MSYDTLTLRFDNNIRPVAKGDSSNGLVLEPDQKFTERVNTSSYELVLVQVPAVRLRWGHGSKFECEGQIFYLPYEQFGEEGYETFTFDPHGRQTFPHSRLGMNCKDFGRLRPCGWALPPDVKRKINKWIAWT